MEAVITNITYNLRMNEMLR